MLVRDRFFIGGQWVAPSGKETIDVHNAGTGEVMGRVPAGTRPITSPLPALCTSIVSLPEGATHWPPMRNLSRISISCPGSKERLPGEAAEGSAYCS